MFRLEIRRLQGDFIEVFWYLKSAHRKDREKLFSRERSDRTRENGFKLKAGRLKIDIRKGEAQEQIAQRLSLIHNLRAHETSGTISYALFC